MPLFTWMRVAWSNRSLMESPMTRKFGRRIQQVFTEQDPDIPWHLHSSRISSCTCCKNKKIFRVRSITFERNSRVPYSHSIDERHSSRVRGNFIERTKRAKKRRKIIQLLSINEILWWLNCNVVNKFILKAPQNEKINCEMLCMVSSQSHSCREEMENFFLSILNWKFHAEMLNRHYFFALKPPR